jgi:hypothetical protein
MRQEYGHLVRPVLDHLGVDQGVRTTADLPARIERVMWNCRRAEHRACPRQWTIRSVSVQHGRYSQPTTYRCTCACH